jgi:probable HAF family extracellular repeat protein
MSSSWSLLPGPRALLSSIPTADPRIVGRSFCSFDCLSPWGLPLMVNLRSAICGLVLVFVWLTFMFAVDYRAAAQSQFTIADLGALGGENLSSAYGVNDHGDVVGTSSTSGARQHAFLWRDGTMIDIGVLAGTGDSIAFDVNDRGQVVGNSPIGPFLWENGVMTPLPLLPGHRFGQAMGINNVGQIAGSSEGQAVTWINGTILPLDAGGGWYTSAEGINDRGQIVGSAVRPQTGHSPQAVIWENGVIRNLPRPALPGCPDGSCVWTGGAMAINEHGVVAGWAANFDERSFAVKWENGRGANLENLPGSFDSSALRGSINDRGDIVGISQVVLDGVAYPVATLWREGSVQALPPPVSPVIGGTIAIAMNNGGHIVGSIGPRAALWTLEKTDETPPQISLAVRGGGRIWPPNGKLVAVTFTGIVSDHESGVAHVVFMVVDEYGRVQPSGPVALVNGRFSITVRLEASRRGGDRDGRRYVMRVFAEDSVGNKASAVASAVVPHDQR